MVQQGSKSGNSRGAAFSKEDELLLQDYSQTVSRKSSLLYYGNALIVSAIPLWLYVRLHMMEPMASAAVFVIGTAVSTWLVAYAYRNTKHTLKHKVAVKREAAVMKEMTQKLQDDKKTSRKEKDERILWKKNEVAEYEATTFSIFYNNALFLAILILASFYILKGLSPTLNYAISMTLASGIIALLSTGTKV